MLSAEASAEPGRWDTGRAEYQRAIMDAVSDHRVETVVVMSSAQVGKTEILNNLCGYHIHQDPAPILVVQPSVEMGETWSKDRLAPMLRDSPSLKGRVADAKSRTSGNTVRHKTFAGGHLTITGANSAAGLASRPIRILCCDEVDRYDASAGSEGDPVNLAVKRTTTFWNRKIILVSTPLIAGSSRIEKAYLESDQRRFWIPCPHCSEMQVLKWANVQWSEDDPRTAAYHCVACGAAWTDAQRWVAVRRGEWRAEAEFRGVAGFHLSELYSPWRKISETVGDFLRAKSSVDQLKTWVNTALGETWKESGEAPEFERLLERREDFRAAVVPPGGLVLTAGTDAQDDRLETSVWAWAPGFESWLVDHIVTPGSPRDAETWDAWSEVLHRDWPRAGGGVQRLAKVCVDTGGRDTAAIYGHLRRIGDARVAGIKGVDSWGQGGLVTGPTLVDATSGGRKLKGGFKLWSVAVSGIKSDLYRRLRLARAEEEFPTGWVHLPAWADAEWVKQLVSEELRSVQDRRKFTRQEWHKLRDRNEALDCAVYARAALSLLGADRYGERFWRQLETERADEPVQRRAAPPVAVQAAEVGAATRQPQAGGFFGGPRRGYFGR
jgi:phage terminase large subunit GpA-like protein